MPVLAVSDFMHSLFIILVATPFILLWGCAIWDLIHSHHSGWAIVGWMLVILVILMLIFGANRLPEIGRGLGKGIRGFKEATREGMKDDSDV